MSQATSAATSIGVERIQHVTLVVDDLERSRHFYCDILGMELMERPVFGFPGMWFCAGNTEVHLILHQQGCADPGYPNEAADTEEGLIHHFAFVVENVFEAAEKLKKLGVRIQGGPPGRRPDCVQLWCYDPDGHIVELFDGSRDN